MESERAMRADRAGRQSDSPSGRAGWSPNARCGPIALADNLIHHPDEPDGVRTHDAGRSRWPAISFTIQVRFTHPTCCTGVPKLFGGPLVVSSRKRQLQWKGAWVYYRMQRANARRFCSNNGSFLPV